MGKQGADSRIDFTFAAGEENLGHVRGAETGFALRLFPELEEEVRVVVDGDTLAAEEGVFALRGAVALAVVLLPREDGGAAVRRADFDGSGQVDLADFFVLADFFGLAAEGPAAAADLDGSGVVDLADFFALADLFGRRSQPAGE